MTTDRDSFDLKFGRFLWWGLLAVVAILVLVVILANAVGDGDDNTTSADQVEWSIVASEYTPNPGLVTLKGDEPLGFPTETWLDDQMLARSVDARDWDWNMDANPPVPTAVYDIDQAGGDCDALGDHLELWAGETGQALGEALRATYSAFAQYAADTMAAEGCG